MAKRTLTKTERLNRDRLIRNLQALEDESRIDDLLRDLVPDAWRTLEDDVDVRERKVQITLRLDESVAKFFRAYGPGYQARINRVLATFAQMRIARAELFDRQRVADLEWLREMERRE